MERPLPFRGKATFCSTVREGIRLNCWKIMPIFFRTFRSSLAGSSVGLSFFSCPGRGIRMSSWPSTVTDPAVGFSSRLMQRTRVDFPAPE